MQTNEPSEAEIKPTFNLLKLCEQNDKTMQSWIYASGEELQYTISRLLTYENLEDVIESLKADGMASHRKKAKTFTYMKNLLLEMREGTAIKWFPLALLVHLSRKLPNPNEIITHIDKLGTVKDGSKVVEINAIKKLDINLAKLIGIHAADGSVSSYNGQLWIKDENYYNLSIARNLFGDVFGILPRIIKLKRINAWGLYINNKVITRYFVKIFGFNYGYKTDSVCMPKIVKGSTLEIKRAFASGVLMSDGYVGFDGKVGINCKSRRLIEDVHSVLIEDTLKISVVRNYIHNSKSVWHFHARAPIKMAESEKRKWLEYFDVGSEKWHKVKETVFGHFEGKTNDYESAKNLFKIAYHGGNNSKIKLIDVIETAAQLGQIEEKQLAGQLNVSISTASKYTRLLNNANILTVVKRKKSNGFGKGSSPFVYLFNKNIYEWKVPYRPVLNEVSA